MSAPKKLFLLDAFALIYRAYFAFSNNHRVNSKGLNTSAIFGFTNTLLEVLKKEKPSHIAVVFDTAAPTQRHEEFADYKANREEMPDDLKKSLPYIKKLIEGFNIPIIGIDGYEADDVIGTLAKKAEQKGYITYMMTPDKDYGQLVSENIFIYKPARGGAGAEILGPAEICKRWDIKRVDQVIEILGLMGDAVDNIPGIRGVGEKTAIQLIKDFDTIENLIQSTDKLKGKLKEKVELGKEMAIQSKRLATIILDVPVDLEEDKLILDEPNKESLRDLFAELEFKRLAEQILGRSETISAPEPTPEANANVQRDLFGNPIGGTTVVEEEIIVEEKILSTIENTPHKYTLINDDDACYKLLDDLLKQKEVCFDTETTGLNQLEDELVGLAFSYKTHEGYYVAIPEDKNEAKKRVEIFRPFFESNITKIAHNIKFDLAFVKRYGIVVNGPCFDTMIAHYVLFPEESGKDKRKLDTLARIFFNYSPVPIEALIGKKGKAQLNMRQVPLQQIADYAAEDADITFRLKEKLSALLEKSPIKSIFSDIEIPLVPVLEAMETEGIKLNAQTLNEYSTELEKEILLVEDEIQQMANRPLFKNGKGAMEKWNLNSPKQVGEVLFEQMNLVEKAKKTKTGQYATGEEILIKIEHKHPIISKILDYRELTKLKNTYVDTLPHLVNKNTGHIHTSFNQVVASTGRLSSDNPNLQNIPIRTDKGKEVRKVFVPRDENYTLLSADYSQIELRIMAHMSKDAGMIEAFQQRQDIHTATAAKVYGVSLENVSSDMRRNAKMVNFGIIYGISAFGLADRLSISRTEAKTIIENYFQKYASVKEYMDESVARAKEKGYTETILGRRLNLKNINASNALERGYAERIAINAPIQGSAADMIKLAMINIHKKFIKQNFKSKMLLQVHDELVFDAHKDELEIIKPVIESCMINAMKMDVPVEVGIGTGLNWLEAH
jgi:DNA polymerase-1